VTADIFLEGRKNKTKCRMKTIEARKDRRKSRKGVCRVMRRGSKVLTSSFESFLAEKNKSPLLKEEAEKGRGNRQ
jgi:hypothetical protein